LVRTRKSLSAINEGLSCEVGNLAQSAAWSCNTLLAMSHHGITISSVEQDGGDGLIVTFSDGTTAGYVVEELLELRPARQNAPIKPNNSKVPATHN
jgi:hypothetical protein